MSLLELIDNTRTDKNTLHSYINVYDELFKNKKETSKNILEIGNDRGGSIKLWSQYFKNAEIHAVDIIKYDDIWDELKNKDNIFLHTNDAYDVRFFANTFLNTNKKFDIIIDDGPHTIESMILFLNMYIHLLEDDGILIIEDVQNIKWVNTLIYQVPDKLRKYIKVYDLRNIKKRYDDILFVVNLGKKI
jgi:Methyltransferase domain